MRIRLFAALAAAFLAGPGPAAAAGADEELAFIDTSKKLIVVIDMTDASGTSTSTADIAEHRGRLGIAMPVPAN